MNISVEMTAMQLSDLQEHMAQLVQYYESDVAMLGRINKSATGAALPYLHVLLKKRLKQLNSIDELWVLLTRY